MMLLALFVTVCCTLASSVNSVSVAPGDIDQTCRNEPGRKSVPKNQKVLLDTQDYRETTLLNIEGSRIWKSIDFDGKSTDSLPKWRDNSQTNDCLHSFFVCDPDNKPQDNWMITQYINITDDGVNELTINMTFSTAQPVGQCPNCEQSFFVYLYETNVIDETGRVNQSFYMNTGARFFHTIGDVPQESDNSDISVSSKGLYLSVIDTGSCTLINRISVFYYVCPYQVVNMVVYPETVSPPSSGNFEDRTAIATCIDNASPVSGGSTNLECDSGGIWKTSDISCICDPGYEVVMEACEACQEGEYKSIQGNEDCLECPENSNSTQTGATSCDCISGYYRASSENITIKCTAPPTAPVDVRNDSVGSTSVNISWSPPTDSGGRTDLYYTVTYSNGSFVSPVLSVGTGTQYTLTGLTPLTEYTISVTSVNGVSDQDSNTANRTTSIRVTTTNRGPTPPAEFEITTDPNTGTTSILDWEQPVNLYGTLMHYNILIATTDDPSLAEVVATTTDTTFDLNVLDNVEPGTYYVWVQAVTDNGMGDFSPSISYVRDNRVPTPPQDFELLANSNTGSISILQWKQPVYLFGTLIHYNILMSTSNDTSLAKVVFMTNDTTFDLSILDIEEGSYYVWVQAVTSNGAGGLSPSVIKYVAEDTKVSASPQQFNISANPNTGTTSILDWEQPTNLNGIFMHYNILIATTSNSSRAKVVAKTNDTRFDLSTLEIEAGTYYVWVQAVTSDGAGDFSTSVNYVIEDNKVSTAPQQFNISANPNTGAISILNWEQPTNLNGIFMHYNILIATTSNSSRAEVVATTNDTTFDLSMLDIEAGTYYVWVQAVTDNGAGEFSAAVNYVKVDDRGTTDSNIAIIALSIALGTMIFILLGAVLLIISCYALNQKQAKEVKNGEVQESKMISSKKPRVV